MQNETNPLTPAGISLAESEFQARSAFHKSRKGFISLRSVHRDTTHTVCSLFLTPSAFVHMVKYLAFAKCKMKPIHSRPQAFHSLKANFKHEVHFTNPARDLFHCVVFTGTLRIQSVPFFLPHPHLCILWKIWLFLFNWKKKCNVDFLEMQLTFPYIIVMIESRKVYIP